MPFHNVSTTIKSSGDNIAKQKRIVASKYRLDNIKMAGGERNWMKEHKKTYLYYVD